MTKFARIFTAVVVALALIHTFNAAQAKKTVVATIAQIGEPLSVIAGDRAKVLTLMGDGVDPHLYRLTRSDVIKLKRADLIVYNGLNLETQVLKVLTRLAAYKPVIGVADIIQKQGILTKDGGSYDPHVWMDPILWGAALKNAVDALAKIDPPNAEFYQTNTTSYLVQLANLNSNAKKAIASIPGESGVLVTAHDAFGYFARAYGLEALAIQGISTESEAGIKKIEALVDTLVQRRVSAVFVESTVSTRNVQALIEGAAARDHQILIGGKLFSDAMGPRETDVGTYFGMFEHNVTTIAEALGGKAQKRESIDHSTERELLK